MYVGLAPGPARMEDGLGAGGPDAPPAPREARPAAPRTVVPVPGEGPVRAAAAFGVPDAGAVPRAGGASAPGSTRTPAAVAVEPVEPVGGCSSVMVRPDASQSLATVDSRVCTCDSRAACRVPLWCSWIRSSLFC